jgi:ATP-dependent Clp protease ATP-binding subunit ClpC
MRLTLNVYVSVEREEGRSIYVCQSLRGPNTVAKDPLLSTAFSKLGSQLRKQINGWIEAGQGNRVSAWLYDPETQSKSAKLTLVLRDRTLRWRLLLVILPAFDRFCAFSPSIPDVVFECDSMQDLEQRATVVYTQWAQSVLTESGENALENIGDGGEMWVEPLEIEVETKVRPKKKSKDIFAALFGGGKPIGSEELHKVGTCLDDAADVMDVALGRGELVSEVDHMLQREDRQGVLLVGPPAVGKTAIIHECVKRRVERFRSRRGHRPQVWWLSPQRLISGMSYLGQWEQRWLAILAEASKRDHILYFDDLVGLFTAGRTRDSSLNAADVLRSFLSEHRVRIVGEITNEQLAILRRRDRALADRFHLVHVPTLSANDALPIILESAHNIEMATGRFFHPEIAPLVTRHQEIFAPDRAFPGKAIEMFKTLAKHASLAVHSSAVYRLAGTQSGATLELLLNRLGNQNSIQKSLASHLVGQPGAVEALSRIVVRYAQHLQPSDRPLGVLLFLGPTGVGKTESAKALTRMLYSDESHLVRLDMNELTTPMAAEELVGTFDRPDGRLTAAVRRQPNCVILLDEIEKAHPDVFDYLLQVLGEGRLTDARGRIADFRSSIIIMTSNLGATEQSSSLGFDVSAERRSQIYTKSAQQFFRPEFFNRIDEVVAFRSLDPVDMERIVQIQLEQVLARDGIKRRGAFVKVGASAIKRIIQSGFDAKLGARAVRRMMEREIIGPIGDVLSGMPLGAPTLVHVCQPEGDAKLACDVLPLKFVAEQPSKRLEDLGSVIAATDKLFRRLESKLGEITPDLNAIDAAVGGRIHNASYYALREQLYRCSELRKAAEFRLSQRTAPRLDIAPQSPSKPRSKVTERGPSKSALRDWAAHEDLRAELSGGTVDASLQSIDGVTEQLLNAFVVANAMIENALAPRTWLLGFENITAGDDLPLDPYEQLGFDHALLLSNDPPSFLQRLFICLREHWQYEVSNESLAHGFRLVSGVALRGIIGPLLGTYQKQVDQQASQLSALRAIPVDAHGATEELNRCILANPILSASGEFQIAADQAQPGNVICGTIGAQTIHFRSAARLEMSPADWYDYEKLVERTSEWWINCLPVPAELRVEE